MTENDDDWFERALKDEKRDEQSSADGPRTDSGDSSEPGDGAPVDAAAEPGNPPETDDPAAEEDGDDDGFEDDWANALEVDSEDDAAGVDAGDDATVDAGDGGSEDDSDGGDGSPFGGGDVDSFTESRNDLFGGSTGGSGGDVFAGGDEGGAFDGGDGGVFAGGGQAGDFGMGDFGMGAGEQADFSDEAVDSDIDRIDLGIPGLDDMIRGGVPESSLMAIIGSAGTGKTTFGQQFLEEGLANDEKAIYITLEESRDRVVRSATEKGWPFEEYVADGQLAVVDMDPVEMANSLSSIRSELPQLVDRFGASRLVLDSVSLLEMMYDDRATRRNEIYTFARGLKEAGVTILLTSEADEDNPYTSRHGIVEYLTDAVYILQYVRPSDFREARLAVEIQKIRDAHHSREMKPYEITDEGISVYRQANIF